MRAVTALLVGPIEMANSLVGQSLKAAHQGVYRVNYSGSTLIKDTL
jgi:hypothetical protein